jgi:hypothetical protein
MKKVAIGLSLLFVGKWILDKIHLSKNISFAFLNADFGIGFPTSKLKITLQINNPTNVITTVSNLIAAVYINGVNIGTANNPSAVDIPANNSINYVVVVYLNSVKTGQEILNAIVSKQYFLKLDGTVVASNITLPFTVDYAI